MARRGGRTGPSPWREPGILRTPGGAVSAREIILALNVWGTSWPLSRRQTNFASAVVLTESVPELFEQIGGRAVEAVIDGRMFLDYFRPTPDGRVLMGSGSGRLEPGGRVGPGSLPMQLRSAAHTSGCAPSSRRSRTFGSSPAGAVRSTWRRTSCRDSAPSVLGTRIHYGAGYSGNGVGPSWLGGGILASLALGLQDEWPALPLVHRRSRRLPPEPFRYVGGRVVRWGTLSAEDARGAGRRPSAVARAAAAIPRLLRMPIGVR